jgi:hypothetical protein
VALPFAYFVLDDPIDYQELTEPAVCRLPHRRPYGGAVVKGQGLMAIVWGGCVVDEGCGSRGGPGVLGFATVVMLIFGGLLIPRPLFVARPPSALERGRR